MSIMPNAVITGSNGFVGQWLAKLLQAEGYSVTGIDNSDLSRNPDITYEKINILERDKLESLFGRLQPELIFHLAGVSYLPDADKSPLGSIEINVLGTLSIFEAARNSCQGAKILFIGSSKEYSSNINANVITEDIHPLPENFYGITKYCAELFGQQYNRQFGMKIFFTQWNLPDRK